MESIQELCREYDLASYRLRSQYIEKIREAFPNVKALFSNAYTLFDKNEYGYCVLDRYEQILQEYENQSLSPIIRDIVKEKLSVEYDKLCQLQYTIARMLSYADPFSVTVPKILKDYTKIDKMIHLPFQLKDQLDRLEHIHQKHSQLFTVAQEELKALDEDFDNAFLKMSADEIGKFNETLTTQAENNQQLYETEREVQSKVVSNMQLRGDPLGLTSMFSSYPAFP